MLSHWGGIVRDQARMGHLPPSGYIADNGTWTNLWREWKETTPPPVDFRTHIVLVAVASGPNEVRIKPTIDESGNLVVSVTASKMGGSGFGYSMITIERGGIATVNGKHL